MQPNASTQHLIAFLDEAIALLSASEEVNIEAVQELVFRSQQKRLDRQERWRAEHSLVDVDRYCLPRLHKWDD